ncbi:MAG: DNA replication/repair protein RecF [Oscillospiraceae bacterium]|nr:DNA replication/repair protein RecF [Oscillospiraceae bacterium]
MTVNKIRLRGYRNYEDETAEFSPKINVICGKNAQGKTNLLEAVYLLGCGKSFRASSDKELIRFGELSAEINAEFSSEKSCGKIDMLLRPGLAKQIKKNGAKIGITELPEYVRTVLFCPDDLSIIKSGPGERRILMDRAICQLRPGYAGLISDYRKILDNKSSILKNYREDKKMLSYMDTLSDAMCVLSARIARYRASFVRRLGENAVNIHSEFSGVSEKLSLSYKTISTVTNPEGAETVTYEEIKRRMKELYEKELMLGQSLVGIHKDDILISVNGLDARSYASQGQMRTAALSIKLSEREIHFADTGEYPVLLLDDVLSELDKTRRDFILNHIGDGQTIISCCEEDMFSQTGGKIITVSEGKISC